MGVLKEAEPCGGNYEIWVDVRSSDLLMHCLAFGNLVTVHLTA